MPRRPQGYGRSQARGSQGLSQPTQLPRQESEEEEEEEEQLEQQQSAPETSEEEEEDGDSELTTKANALVRLALFNESRRVALKREEINKKVMGSNTRLFKAVFAEAQKKLQSVFGMELVEPASRAGREQERFMAEEFQDEIKAGRLRKRVGAGSKTYILRSTLHTPLLELSNMTDEDLLQIELEEAGEDDDDEQHEYGSIFKWRNADHLGGLGLLHVVLSLILVSGRSLPDMDLKKHLRTLRSSPGDTILFPPSSTQSSMTIDLYLSSFVRQGYLEKVKVDNGIPRGPTQKKRGRTSRVDDDENAAFEWRWGSRADAEIGESAVGQFIAQFTVERMLKEREMKERLAETNGEGSSRRQVQRDLRATSEEIENMLENIENDIEKAAGGVLKEIRL